MLLLLSKSGASSSLLLCTKSDWLDSWLQDEEWCADNLSLVVGKGGGPHTGGQNKSNQTKSKVEKATTQSI